MSDSDLILSFNQRIAKETSISAAIVFHHIVYWIKKNKSKGKNLINGKTWMYETAKEISSFLEIISEDHVQKSLKLLVSCGYLIKDKFNDSPFTHTSWYALPDEIDSSKKVYDSDKKAETDSDKKAETYKDTEEQTEKQQASTAAAAAAPSIFKCLESLNDPSITEKEKKRITQQNLHQEQVVIDAVNRITEAGLEPNETLLKLLNAAIKGKWKLAEKKISPAELKKRVSENYRDVEALSDLFEKKAGFLIFHSGLKVDLSLEPKEFKKQIYQITKRKV